MTDKERLDAIEKNLWQLGCMNGGKDWYVDTYADGQTIGSGDTVRAAIDDAITWKSRAEGKGS